MLTTRVNKAVLLAATGMAAAMICAPALAQETTTTATPQPEAAKAAVQDADTVIIVKGIRGSIKSATDRKRKSKQIVDSVDAEDVGKLPDNNVPEALAHVTGVQIDRAHGEGSGVSIRGMTDISTTINGNNSNVGESRTMNLSDIPAELLKSVQVYKTRTADQVEGGIAGTVNVDLRRPLDLKKGLTVAGSFRNVFSSIGDTSSPYASLLVANRFNTNIGEMGFLINLAYTRNNYEENFLESESPDTFCCTSLTGLPADQQNIIAPYAVNYGVEKGAISRPSVNIAGQWRVNDQLDFVLEGSYFSSEEKRYRDRLHLTVRDGNSAISDVVLQPDGKTVKSLTMTAPGDSIGSGPESYFEQANSHAYTTNFEAHWHNDRTTINSSVQYNWSDVSYYGILTSYRLAGAKTATVDFDSDMIPGGGPYVTFPGVDLTDPASYLLFLYHDEQTVAKNRYLGGQSDLTYRVSDDKFLRSFQAGIRFSKENTSRSYGYRDGAPNDWAGTLPVSEFPGYTSLSATTPDLEGSPSWLHIPGEELASNAEEIRDWLYYNSQDTTDINHNVGGGADWTLARPALNQGQTYRSTEYTSALYAQINYAFMAHFPIDGTIGVRATKTWGNLLGARYSFDDQWMPVVDLIPAKGDYSAILPNANAIVHFSPKMQLRVAYTENMQRPNFFDLRPFIEVHALDTNVYAGNPDLQPNYEKSYDASLEYYFGRGGSVSFAAYVKKQDGYQYYSGQQEHVDELVSPANPDGIGTVYKVRNAGPGTFQGYEFAAQGFFEFLPGRWQNLGGSFNYTYLQVGKILYPYNDPVKEAIPGVYDAIGMSKYTYNFALYYDTPVFSARVSYNYRDKYKTNVWDPHPEYSPYIQPTSRLDMAINWTPRKYVTFSLEGTNLEKNSVRQTWGDPELLPQGIRLQARTVQLSARFRY